MGLVALLGDEELDLAVTRPQMLDLVAQFEPVTDADLAALAAANFEAVKAFTEGAASVAGLDALFTPSALLADVITQDTLAADTALLPGNLANGAQIVTDLDGLFTTSAAPPTPAPAPMPAPGGGGRGGGGGGICDPSDSPIDGACPIPPSLGLGGG